MTLSLSEIGQMNFRTVNCPICGQSTVGEDFSRIDYLEHLNKHHELIENLRMELSEMNAMFRLRAAGLTPEEIRKKTFEQRGE